MRLTNLPSRWLARGLLVIAAALIIACGPGATDEELVERAKGYLAEKKINAATIELRNALQANPHNTEARYLLGEIYLQVGNFESAEKELQRAFEMGWSAGSAVTGKTRAMVAQGKYKQVLEASYATDDWPASAQANLQALLAGAYLGEGDMQKASSVLLFAKSLEENAYDVLRVTILMHLEENRKEDAEAAISKAQALFPQDSELMLMSADLALMNKQYEEAIRIFEQIIGLGPKNLMTLNMKRAHLGILKLAIMQKDFSRVQKSREAFVASKIDDPEVNYFMALAAFEEKNMDEAEAYLQKVLLVSSSHGPTLLLSGLVSYTKQEFEKAAYYSSKCIANHPENSRARTLLGRSYLALGQYEEARKEFSAVLKEHPGDAELIALVGLSEIRSGEVESGITGLEKALEMVPENASLKLELAKAYIADGQTDEGIRLLDEMLQKDGNKDLIRTLKVLAYLRNNDIELAMNTARKMLVKSANRADVLSLIGGIQLAARDTAVARNYFNQALEIDRDHLRAKLSLARLDEQQGDIAAAEERYLSILEKEPKNITAMTSLAQLAARQGDTGEQIRWLEAARDADKKGLPSRIALVEIYLKLGNMADAETLIRELEETHSKNIVVLTIKGKLLFVQKRFTQAEMVASEIIGARPDLDIGYYLQAQSQLALGNNEAALRSSRKAYSLKPDERRNVILLARVEQSTGNFKRAMELGEDVISIAPGSAVGYVLKGDALQAQKQYQLALANYDKAWAIEESRDIAIRRFNVKRRLTGVTEAASVLTGWLENRPADEVVLLKLATAHIAVKNNKEAQIYFEKVLALQPDNTAALNNLAWLYGLNNEPRALALAEKAYDIEPSSPEIADTYGWILLKNNKKLEALTILKQAAAKLPDVPEVQFHYAKALFETGDTATADRIFKALVESGKAFEGRTDAERMLVR